MITHQIATANAGRVCSAFAIASILMLLLMPVYGFGFVFFVSFYFVWLYSLSYELAVANRAPTRQFGVASILGIASSFLFVYGQLIIPGYQEITYGHFVNLALNALFIFGCIKFLTRSITVLLARLEVGGEAKEDGGPLAFNWVTGVWRLQPRLQKALALRAS